MNMPVKVNKSRESEMKNKSTSPSEVNTTIPRLSSLSLSTSKTTSTETSVDATSSSSTLSANSATSTHQPVARVATLSTSSSPTIIVANNNQQQIENHNDFETKSEKNCCSDGEDERGNEDDTNKKLNVDDCDDDDDEDADSLIIKKEKRVLGCAHYKRRAMFVTPCCNKFYKCRYCHDENEDHHFDRKTLTELICSECDTRQRVQEVCENCGVRFGKYTCLICNLFDDEDKAQYHCNGCGICRIGGRKNFFHCEVCNMCLPIQLKIEGHRCVENISRSNCPVCLGDIHTSRIPCHIPDCGHLLHKMCFDQLLASGHYVCPTCQTSIIDMTKMWEYLDEQALLMPVPKIYENRLLNIFCNDCHKTSTVKFHFIGLKCFYCGGYNTTQDVKRRRSWVMVNSKDNASTSA